MLKKQIFFLILSFTAQVFMNQVLVAQELPKEILKESISETHHKVKINGKELSYKATTGTLLLKDEADKVKASIFYVAYTKERIDKEDSDKLSERPITFCFNGGPGSSSVWLHLGVFGPRRVALDDDGKATPPYHLVENEYSILDLTDLVFIDPVSTGFSRPAPGEEAKQFYGVEEDVKSIAQFIRLYTTKQERWESPKYLAGESYGTTRAAALAKYLHDEEFYYLNGVALISSILNFQTLLDPQGGNDLPYITYLPTYTATAWYYKKLSQELLQDLSKTLKESEQFALNEYATALMQGDLLSKEKRREVVEKLARYTGLEKDYIDRSNLRINSTRFAKELLRKEKKTIGRFDTRYTGTDYDSVGERPDYDPSAEAIFGAFTGAFNEYIRKDLKWKEDACYKILTDVFPWNYSKSPNQFLHVGEALRETMTKNPSLKIFVGSSYFDLATPYFGTDYTFSHLELAPDLKKHIQINYYEAGHMMYVHRPSLVKLKNDLIKFYQQKKP